MMGCWHLHEAMQRSPFSRMNYITLTVFVAIAALRCYWGMERGLRRVWLDKTEAGDCDGEQQRPLQLAVGDAGD